MLVDSASAAGSVDLSPLAPIPLQVGRFHSSASVLPFPMAECRANQVLSQNFASFVGVDHSAASAHRRREFDLLKLEAPTFSRILLAFSAS